MILIIEEENSTCYIPRIPHASSIMKPLVHQRLVKKKSAGAMCNVIGAPISENFDGLVRRYFPKGTNSSKTTDEQVVRPNHLLMTGPERNARATK
jgi:hypothetical protein